MDNKHCTLFELSNHLNLKAIGQSDYVVTAISSLISASKTDLSYISDKKYLPQLKTTQAGIVILSDELSTYHTGHQLISNNPALSIAQCGELFRQNSEQCPLGVIEKTAIIHPDAIIDKNVYIGHFCIIEKGVTIGKNTIIKSHCTIEKNSNIGENNYLENYVHIYQKSHLGCHNFIDSHTRIGRNGFGDVKDEKGHWHTITHFGSVYLGNHIHIGSNVSIDRGRFDNTIIKDGVRLDNLIHIAHNVQIGKHTVIAAGTKIAGSTIIGAYCTIAGMVGIENHLKIADKVVIYSGCIVRRDIDKSGRYFASMPILSYQQGLRLYALLKNAKIIPFLKKYLKT